jgi:hypothetical protein
MNLVSKSSLPIVPTMCNLTKWCASTSSTTTTTKIPLFANPSTNNKLCRLLDHTAFDDFERSAAAPQLSKYREISKSPALFQKVCASLAAQLCIKVWWHYVICSFHSN